MNDEKTIPSTMFAWACNNYGGPEHLSLQHTAVPRPKDHQLLIKVAAATVDSADVRIRTQKLPKGMGIIGRLVFGIKRPRWPILGTSIVGEIVSMGTKVSGFSIGDRIAGMTGMKAGGHAQYCCINSASAAKVPDSLSNEDAVSIIFGGVTALHFLRSAHLKPDENVLVIGASGTVGAALVQLAFHQKANVTAMTSEKNLDWVTALGANEVFDYHQNPFDRLNNQFDVIADAVGATTFKVAKHKLKEHGRYLAIAGGLTDMLARPSGTKRSIKGVAPEAGSDISTLLKLLEQGAIKPVIHNVMSWSELPNAHAIAETGRKRGSIVINVE